MNNWLGSVPIPVSAKFDGVVDGDKTRVAYVWSTIYYQGSTITGGTNVNGEVNVSLC